MMAEHVVGSAPARAKPAQRRRAAGASGGERAGGGSAVALSHLMAADEEDVEMEAPDPRASRLDSLE